MTTKASAMIRRTSLHDQRPRLERWAALVLLGAGVVGTVIAFGGGWSAVLERGLRPGPTLAALALQGLLTALQWYYHDRRLLAWGSRLIDAALTAVGFSQPAVPLLAGLLVLPGVRPDLAAWVVLGALSLYAAWYPEASLITD